MAFHDYVSLGISTRTAAQHRRHYWGRRQTKYIIFSLLTWWPKAINASRFASGWIDGGELDALR